MATLIFEFGFDERDQDEAKARGYLSHVQVQLSDGNRFAVVFYDYVRLGQDLEEECKLGNGFVADPGMIVLAVVTLENMQAAVNRLEAGKFFENFSPVKK